MIVPQVMRLAPDHLSNTRTDKIDKDDIDQNA